MTTPIEKAAEAVLHEYPFHPDAKAIARAVFGSIDRDELAGVIHHLLCGCSSGAGALHFATTDAIIAWLTAKTGEEQS